MKTTRNFLVFLIIFSGIYAVSAQEQKAYEIRTVAFYNLENLFDTEDDILTFDDDRTPGGKDNWTEKNYHAKLKNMAFAIRNIGMARTEYPPVLLGVCEVENRKVLEDLIREPDLADFNYGIIHYDSPDTRGIDVALLYQQDFFSPQNSRSHELLIYDNLYPTKRVYTRDQLVVSGVLEGEEIHLIVNHWPSRSGGVSRSSYRREAAAVLNKKIIDSLQMLNPYAKIITMGDFNDDPSDKSLKRVLGAKSRKEQLGIKDLYNPMAALSKKGIGSSAYRDGWNLFDQIIISRPFIDRDYNSYSFYQAGIGNEKYLITPSGQYKGYPFRSFGFGGFTNGYSDHFPVYIYLIKQKNQILPSR